jgi:lysophospholipase L1-like esterase
MVITTIIFSALILFFFNKKNESVSIPTIFLLRRTFFTLSIIYIFCTSCRHSTRVVFLGDSITELAENNEGKGTYKGFITLLREDANQKLELINKGIGGDKVPDLLLRYKTDVLQLQPDVVFIYIGINDVWHKYNVGTGSDIDLYENGLRRIIEDTQATGAKIIMCTPTVIGENSGEFTLVSGFKNIEEMEAINKDLDAFSNVVRTLSFEFNIELLDLRKKFKNYISENNSTNASHGILTYDGVHLNNAGNKLIADEMIRFLK